MANLDRHFVLSWCFPDADAIFKRRYKILSEIKTNCLVGLDTNVLLAPYKLDSASLHEIRAIYSKLAKAGRLVVPAQVVREYERHRPNKLAALIETLNNQSSRAAAPIGQDKMIRFLLEDSNYATAVKLSNEIQKLVKEFQKNVNEVVRRLGNWTEKDPVLEVYDETLSGSIYELVLDDEQRKGFGEELRYRYDHRIPPGFKDDQKSDQGSGDLIIWKTILDVGRKKKRDFLFVTFEEKNDWLVKTRGQAQPLPELLDEYGRASGGATIHIISLPGFLKLFEAKAEVVAATETAEREVHRELADERSELYAERSAIEARLAELQEEEKRMRGSLASMPVDYNESLSLPWNRAAPGLRIQLRILEDQQRVLKQALDKINSRLER
jgi:PIN like domain